MSRATVKHNPVLKNIENCYVEIPGSSGSSGAFGSSGSSGRKIIANALPDISDSKSATYSDENVAGRSSPYKVYGYSSARSISFTFHFYNTTRTDFDTNMANLRALTSCAYPREATDQLPYQPPTVCKLKCGKLLADNDLCVILINYNVKFPTDVAWDERTYLPYRFDVDTTWEVVYASINLPGANKIINSGG